MKLVHNGTPNIPLGVNMCNKKENARIGLVWDYICGYCHFFKECPIGHECKQVREFLKDLEYYENLHDDDTEE